MPRRYSNTPPDLTAFDPTAAGTGVKWYFDNPATLGTARADFLRKFGDRQLQDNWRTSRQASSAPNALANGSAPVAVTGNNDTRINGGTETEVATATANPDAQKQTLVAQYRKDLPLTPQLIEASDKQVEAALYELGGIYKEQLKERDKGIETYEKQVARYVRGEHAPDAYYLLYLHYKDKPDAAKMAQYAAALQREFPLSLYAKLIADPQYREHQLALHNAVASRVDSAFTYYKDQEFRKATAVLARTDKAYPKSDLSDRVAYLKTLLVIRTQPPLTARTSVEKFYKDFPDSPLVPQAQALAQAYQRRDTGEIAGALASTEKPVVSIFRPGEVNNRMRIVYREDESPARAIKPTAPAAVPATGPAKAAPAPVETPKAPAPSGSAGPAPVAGLAKGQLLDVAPAPAVAPATPAPATNAPTTAASPAPAAPTVPATAYTTQLSGAHAVVLVFPKATPAAPDLATQLGTYNNRFFRANNLQVMTQPLGIAQDLVVVRALPGAKVAQSYATKLRGPQSPLARLRGAGYQAVVISLENLTLLQATSDLAGYLAFYQRVYK